MNFPSLNFKDIVGELMTNILNMRILKKFIFFKVIS